MAKLRELIIKISANSSSFQSEIARASRMGENYYRTLEQGGRKAASASRETKRAISELNNELSSIKSTVTGVMGAMAGAFATQQLISYADTWSQLSGRLKLASVSAEDFSRAQQELMSLSQRTGTSLAANTNLYARIAQSMRDAGYASGDVAKVTETIATSLILSGASAAEASSVTTQLSQALASGVLRGEEFNSVMENGGRLARLLAAGMGTTIGGLRDMAQSGQLTTDKIVPILTNTEQLRKEFEQLPQTVSMASQKVENAFMAWVGGANEASGATSTLTGALNGIAGNIDTIATVAGALVGVGLARYFGGLTTSVARATIGVANAAKGEVALAQAQLRGTQIAVARARAAEYRAQQALTASRGTDAQAAAEKRLAAAQASVARNVNARNIAQNNLNNITSVGTRLLGGALGLIGGIPGLVMLGAGAWYTMYQKQEQARQSALEYAGAIDQVLANLNKMTLPETSDNAGKTKEALAAQNKLVDEQRQKVEGLKSEIAGYQQMLASPGPSINGYLINHLISQEDAVKSLAAAQDELSVGQSRLNELSKKSEEIQSALKAVESQRDFLIRQQSAAQNNMRHSLLMVNAEHSEFNRIMSAGNQILTNRLALVNSPMRIPAAPLSEKQQDFIQKSERDKELSALTGEARVIRQAEFAADDIGLLNKPEFADNRQKYIDNQVAAYRNQENLSKELKAGKSAQSAFNKEQKEAERQAEQYARKMADLSVATEVQKVRATQGEKAAELYAAAHEAGTKWTDEQRKAIRASSVALAEWTQKADEAVRKQREMDDALKAMRDGARKFSDEAEQIDKTRGMGGNRRSLYEERQQIDRVYAQSDQGKSATEAYNREIDALNLKYQKIKEVQSDWTSGVTRGMEDWVAEAGDYAEQTASAVQSAMGGMVNNITDMLNGNKASWRDWSIDVLKSIQKILVNAAIVNSIKSMSGVGGWIGAVGDFLGGAAANAKGGVYDSPGLSAYSNQIVSTPTYFAFAKGAGLMGEAGPEAIMPLTRAADGSLGVRAIGRNQNTGSAAPQVFITIDSNGSSQTQSSVGYEQFGREIGQYVDQRYRALINTDLRPGGAIWSVAKGVRQ
ncbi:phage tail tape measure protein [Morganella morganii]|uniref:phage tail tape measure protein n=1 Tax=Morganella morganii TaxID=582 RepID=UPI001BDAC352|nr:phage tail tape measure protein [Morganella morganii]MBT0506806.1 phage tail tape measure protein [Morganella morganii subsp. morganii]MDW7785420.1 phage tail tape measure protein [Morganella morganii]QWM12856.1 phage tail tape measure protein [Morganella morganii subsp. morganii]